MDAVSCWRYLLIAGLPGTFMPAVTCSSRLVLARTERVARAGCWEGERVVAIICPGREHAGVAAAALARGAPARLVLLVNPRGAVTEEPPVPAFALERHFVCGQRVSVLRAYPGGWHVFLQPAAAEPLLLSVLRAAPTAEQLAQCVLHAIVPPSARSLAGDEFGLVASDTLSSSGGAVGAPAAMGGFMGGGALPGSAAGISAYGSKYEMPVEWAHITAHDLLSPAPRRSATQMDAIWPMRSASSGGGGGGACPGSTLTDTDSDAFAMRGSGMWLPGRGALLPRGASSTPRGSERRS